LRLLGRLYAKSLRAPSTSNARITPKRAFVLWVVSPFLILVGVAHLICFLLDELFFRGYRTVEVRQPVFIVGVFRSGTTFIHRLLAKDTSRFTCMKLWEILLAPSVTQKKILLALSALDRRLGSPVRKRILAWEEKALEAIHRIHTLSLFEPEEDDPILLNIFSSFFQYFPFPFDDEENPFIRFDTRLFARDRERIMEFYKRCVKSHHESFLAPLPAYVQPGGKGPDAADHP
jgi:omega-hydroxy-beta-dihydromenaquinone-9 sulfotransferase